MDITACLGRIQLWSRAAQEEKDGKHEGECAHAFYSRQGCPIPLEKDTDTIYSRDLLPWFFTVLPRSFVEHRMVILYHYLYLWCGQLVVLILQGLTIKRLLWLSEKYTTSQPCWSCWDHDDDGWCWLSSINFGLSNGHELMGPGKIKIQLRNVQPRLMCSNT